MYEWRLRFAVVLTVTLGLAAPAHAAFPGDDGRLAVAQGNPPPAHSTIDLWTMQPDGTDPVRVTDLSAGGTVEPGDPAWAADGKRIAFTKGLFVFEPDVSRALGEVWTVNPDGTGLMQVSEGPYDGHPTWSPDGSKIAFHRFDPPTFEPTIRVMNADGTGVTTLHAGFDPAWSPDGARIAFSTGPERDSDIWVMNPDGTGAVPLTTHTSSANEWSFNEAAWSPDGTRIAFSNEETECFFNICESESGDPRQPFREVHVMNSDGTGRTRITFPRGSIGDPAWSPQGDQIAVDSEHAGGGLYVMNSDGSALHRVSTAWDPDWQPLPGPRREDFRSAAQFCTAEREFLGEAEFSRRYGTGNGANAFGRCVSANSKP